jgi:prolipoprotein diacylglyceryltransferase
LIPYFVIPPLQIGPVAVQPFGILAATGVWLASALLLRGARRRGLDEAPLRDFSVWAVVAGVIGGHLVHLLFYHPEELRQGGVLQLLNVWDGLSSTGGVLGGILAAAILLPRAAHSLLALLRRIRPRSGARVGCGAPRMLFGPRSSGASHLLRVRRGVP